MKYIKLIITIFLPSIMLAACSGNSAAKATQDNTGDNPFSTGNVRPM